MPQVNYAFKIRGARRHKRVSQFQLEIKAGLAPGMLSRLENNKVSPSKETLIKVARALELSFEETAELFGIEEICILSSAT